MLFVGLLAFPGNERRIGRQGKMDRNLAKGLTYGILSAFFGAYPYIFFNVAFRAPGMSIEAFCLVYHAMAAFFLLAYLFVSGQASLLKTLARPGWKLTLVGLLEFASVWALFSAMRMMDPTLVSFFNNSQTLFIILLGAIVLQERFNRLEGLGAVTVLAGVYFIYYNSVGGLMKGMLLTIASALLFSGTVILIKLKFSSASPLGLAFFRAVFIAACFGVLVLAQGRSLPAGTALLTPIAAGALFGPFLNILFYFAALRHLDASKTSLIRSAQPVFVLANALLFLHTAPLPLQLVGGAVILVGLWLLVKGREECTPEGKPGTAEMKPDPAFSVDSVRTEE